MKTQILIALACGVCLLPKQGNAALIVQYDSANYASGTWTDSVSGNNATQAVTANQPTLVPGATPTGKSALLFSPAAPDFLSLTTALNSPAFTSAPAFTIFAVASPNFNYAAQGAFVSGDQYGSLWYAMRGYGFNNAQDLTSIGTGAFAGGTGPSSGSGWNVFAASFDGANTLTFYLNGVSVFTNTSAGGTFTQGITTIGAGGPDLGNQWAFDGSLAALRVYDTGPAGLGSSVAAISTQLADTYITVPEPSTLVLACVAGVLLLLSSRRRVQNRS